MQQNDNDIFEEFVGKEVKVPYTDGAMHKIARGRLVGYNQKFVKIHGSLGTIMINVDNIERIAKM